METELTIKEVYEAHIKDTKYHEHVRIMNVELCQITIKVAKAIKAKLLKVYITTKTIKHIYDRFTFDKKSPDIAELIIDVIDQVISLPDIVKRNSVGKRADCVFIKEIGDHKFCVPVERFLFRKKGKKVELLFIETAFVFRKKSLYLEKNEILYKK